MAGATAASGPGEGLVMTGVGQVPPADPAPDSGGGSGKLILVIVLLVVVLAAIGAGLWFLTDVFGDDGGSAAVAADEPESAAPAEVSLQFGAFSSHPQAAMAAYDEG